MTTHKNYVYLSTLYSSHGNGYPVSPEKDKYIAVLPFFRESTVSIDVKKVADCDFIHQTFTVFSSMWLCLRITTRETRQLTLTIFSESLRLPSRRESHASSFPSSLLKRSSEVSMSTRSPSEWLSPLSSSPWHTTLLSKSMT